MDYMETAEKNGKPHHMVLSDSFRECITAVVTAGQHGPLINVLYTAAAHTYCIPYVDIFICLHVFRQTLHTLFHKSGFLLVITLSVSVNSAKSSYQACSCRFELGQFKHF